MRLSLLLFGREPLLRDAANRHRALRCEHLRWIKAARSHPGFECEAKRVLAGHDLDRRCSLHEESRVRQPGFEMSPPFGVNKPDPAQTAQATVRAEHRL